MSDHAATLIWGIRESLLRYMSADRSFEAEVRGGATFDPSVGVRLPARLERDGAIVCDGTVVLRAHDGALTLPLVDVRVEHDGLWIRDVEEPSGRLRLVDLTDPVAEGPRTTWQTTLATDADLLFRYTYAPGVPFAPLVVETQAPV